MYKEDTSPDLSLRHIDLRPKQTSEPKMSRDYRELHPRDSNNSRYMTRSNSSQKIVITTERPSTEINNQASSHCTSSNLSNNKVISRPGRFEHSSRPFSTFNTTIPPDINEINGGLGGHIALGDHGEIDIKMSLSLVHRNNDNELAIIVYSDGSETDFLNELEEFLETLRIYDFEIDPRVLEARATVSSVKSNLARMNIVCPIIATFAVTNVQIKKSSCLQDFFQNMANIYYSQFLLGKDYHDYSNSSWSGDISRNNMNLNEILIKYPRGGNKIKRVYEEIKTFWKDPENKRFVTRHVGIC